MTTATVIDLYSFGPVSFNVIRLGDNNKIIIRFPLTYIVSTLDFGTKRDGYVAVRCDEQLIMNVNNTVDNDSEKLLANIIAYNKKIYEFWANSVQEKVEDAIPKND